MTLPFHTLWRLDVTSWINIPAVIREDVAIVRNRGDVVAIDLETGTRAWSVTVDPTHSSGQFLLPGDRGAVITDRQPDPDRTTELVVVSNGAITKHVQTACVIQPDALVVRDGRWLAIGNDPRSGVVFRGFDARTGGAVVEVPLSEVGADVAFAVRDRILVGNRIGTPGLYWVDLDGANLAPLETAPAHDVRVAGGRVLAALREEEFPRRTIQARDLESGAILWSVPGHGAQLALDADAALHFEEGGEGAPVLRDAATGEVRWRAEPMTDEPGSCSFAGPYVFVSHFAGMTAYRRDRGTKVAEVEDGAVAQAYADKLLLGGYGYLALCRPELA